MSLTPTRRRAEEFARLLEGGARTDDPGLAPLLTLAGALQALPVGPRPDFRDGLRQRLVAVAAVQAEPAAVPGAGEKVREWAASWRTQRRLAFAAGGLAAVTAVAGVGISASRSLPGDPFYGMKTAAEQLQLATTSGDLDRGKLHLAFARTRLNEVDALAHDTTLSAGGSARPLAAGVAAGVGTTKQIVSTLARMDRETRLGTTDLTRAWHDTASNQPIAALSTFTAVQTTELTAVLPDLSPAAKARADQSLALLRGVSAVITQMKAATCGTSCAPSGTGTGTGTNTAPGTGSTPSAPAPSVSGRTPGTTPGVTGAPLPSGAPSTAPGAGTPQLGTNSTPLPLPTLSPIPLPSLTTVGPLPTSTTSVPLPGLTTVPLPSVSSVPLPTASTILPPLPLPSTTLGLP